MAVSAKVAAGEDRLHLSWSIQFEVDQTETVQKGVGLNQVLRFVLSKEEVLVRIKVELDHIESRLDCAPQVLALLEESEISALAEL